MLRDDANYAQFVAGGLSTEDFTSSKIEFDFLVDYRQRYNSWPNDEQMRAKFRERWTPLGGSFQYWLDEFRKQTLSRRAELAITTVLPKFRTDPHSAIVELYDSLEHIKGIGRALSTRGYSEAADERLAEYQHRQTFFKADPDYVFGLKTGFAEVNKTNVGWMPGELIGLYARPTVGKSWVLCREAVIQWLQGYRVLVFSPEMPRERLSLRMDVIAAQAMGIRLSESMIGKGHPDVEANYTRFLERVKDYTSSMRIVDTVGGQSLSFTNTMSAIQDFRPDMVFIDGLSLIESDSGGRRGDDTWVEMKRMSYGYKNAAMKNNIPCFIVHQAVNSRRGARSNNSTAQGRGDDWNLPTLNDAAFGDSFVQACNTVITMAPDQNKPDIRWYAFRKSRDRNQEFAERLAFYWDVDCGRLIDLGNQGGDLTKINNEITRITGGIR